MADRNHSIAAALREARLAQSLDIADLARELKNPRAVLEAIERGDWSRLGAPVFARSLVARYASRLGVAIDLDAVVEPVRPSVLRPQVSTSRMGRLADFTTRHAAYVGGTFLVLPLVYLGLSWTATGPTQYRPLDPVTAPAALATDAAPRVDMGTLADTVADGPAPVVADVEAAGDADVDAASPASLAEVEAAAAPSPSGAAVGTSAPVAVAASLAGNLGPGRSELELRFSGESWIEISGRDGVMLERVLARAGESRRFPVADVGRVTIGNVDATDVRVDGSRVNLDAVRAANVARFALSSDGSIEAVAR